jgi:hypothetical protein
LVRDVTLTLRDGDYSESTDQVHSGRFLAGAWERPGVYDVTVTKPGFVPWTMARVTVEADECHVVPSELRAELKPASSEGPS